MAALLLGYSLMYGPDYALSHREGGQKPLAGVVGAAPTLTTSKVVVLLLYETPIYGPDNALDYRGIFSSSNTTGPCMLPVEC